MIKIKNILNKLQDTQCWLTPILIASVTLGVILVLVAVFVTPRKNSPAETSIPADTTSTTGLAFDEVLDSLFNLHNFPGDSPIYTIEIESDAIDSGDIVDSVRIRIVFLPVLYHYQWEVCADRGHEWRLPYRIPLDGRPFNLECKYCGLMIKIENFADTTITRKPAK